MTVEPIQLTVLVEDSPIVVRLYPTTNVDELPDAERPRAALTDCRRALFTATAAKAETSPA